MDPITIFLHDLFLVWACAGGLVLGYLMGTDLDVRDQGALWLVLALPLVGGPLAALWNVRVADGVSASVFVAVLLTIGVLIGRRHPQ